MDGRRPPNKENEVLEANGKTYIEDIDKPRQFARTYKGFAKIPMSKEDRILRRGVRKRMKKNTRLIQESEQEFTMDELERVLKETKPNKAAGEGDIPYEFLRNLGNRGK